MPIHAEERFLPFTPEQMFDLVADIERYPEFLPWCVGARVTSRDNGVITADLMIGFTAIRERFTSKVTLERPERIDVEYVKGPFRYLKNSWFFIAKDHGCVIEFDIAFEVRSRLLRRIFEPLFSEAVRRMVAAFDRRAAVVYGAGAGAPAPDTA